MVQTPAVFLEVCVDTQSETYSSHGRLDDGPRATAALLSMGILQYGSDKSSF